MPVNGLHIGLDLDGTLVDYSELFWRLAVEATLLSPELAACKTTIRQSIRQCHGDLAWQGLQALAYGERMGQARIFDGVFDALAHWKKQGHRVSLVSHKSRYTHLLGEAGPDLHFHARRCLRQWGFEEYIPVERMYFCPTRQEKCLHIGRLGCHVFVDDLPEVFAHVDFPAGVHSILFAPDGMAAEVRSGGVGATVCGSWQEVRLSIASLKAAHA